MSMIQYVQPLKNSVVLIQCFVAVVAKEFPHLKKVRIIIALTSWGCGNELICIKCLD